MRVGVLASGNGTNLQALLDRVHGRDGITLVAVASDQPQARALQRAAGAGVPTAVFGREEYSGRAERDRAMAAWLAREGVQLVVLAGYMQILSAGFLGAFPGAVINVHPALLPAFPGLGAVEQALAYGVKVTGVTVHFVDDGVDTGPVILQRAVEVGEDDDLAALSERIHAVEHELLPEAVRLIARGGVHLQAGSRRVGVERYSRP